MSADTESAGPAGAGLAGAGLAGAGRAGDSYLLGNSTAEIEHLVNQAAVYADEADALLDAAKVPPGASVVDIGCGVLGILGRLRARVGGGGRVVGVDRDAQILDVARQIDAQQGNGVDFVLGDATSLDLPSDSFDFVHVRTVLLNVTEPERVIAEMARITRPGGVVAIQEPDSASWLCDPPHPAWDELRAELLDAYRRNGKNFDTGRLIGRMLSSAGLSSIKVKATARVTSPGDYYQTFLLTLTGLVREQIVAGGRVSAAEFDAKAADLREHLNQPDALTCQPLMWQAWGTKL